MCRRHRKDWSDRSREGASFQRCWRRPLGRVNGGKHPPLSPHLANYIFSPNHIAPIPSQTGHGILGSHLAEGKQLPPQQPKSPEGDGAGRGQDACVHNREPPVGKLCSSLGIEHLQKGPQSVPPLCPMLTMNHSGTLLRGQGF